MKKFYHLTATVILDQCDPESTDFEIIERTLTKLNNYCSWVGKMQLNYEPGDCIEIEANIEIHEEVEQHLKDYFINYGDFDFAEDQTRNYLDHMFGDPLGDIAELNHEYYNEIKLGNI